MSGWNKTLVSKVTPLSTAKPVSEKNIDDQKATANESEKAFMAARERVSVFVAAVKEAFEQGDGSSFDLRGWLKDALIYVFFLMVFTLYIWAGRGRNRDMFVYSSLWREALGIDGEGRVWCT